jgi:hypothetical protein
LTNEGDFGHCLMRAAPTRPAPRAERCWAAASYCNLRTAQPAWARRAERCLGVASYCNLRAAQAVWARRARACMTRVFTLFQHNPCAVANPNATVSCRQNSLWPKFNPIDQHVIVSPYKCRIPKQMNTARFNWITFIIILTKLLTVYHIHHFALRLLISYISLWPFLIV